MSVSSKIGKNYPRVDGDIGMESRDVLGGKPVRVITRRMVAEKLTDYLQHRLSLAALVDWAEEAMREGEFEAEHLETVREVVSRLGLADVKAFGLTWEDCEEFLRLLGYRVRIEVTART